MKKTLLFLYLFIFISIYSQTNDWKLMTPFVSGDVLSRIEFDQDKIYTISGGKFYVSYDEGNFWTQKSLNNVYDFAIKNNKGYRLGQYGTFVISDANFNTDTYTHTFTTNSYSKIFVLNDNFIVLTGASQIAKSIDGGVTWTYHLLNTGPYANGVRDVYFIDQNVGFAVVEGSSGQYILKSTDGGITWNVVYSDTTTGYYFSQILFKDSLNGVAINSTGNVYNSQDGGITWTKNIYDYNTAVLAMKLYNGEYYGVGYISNLLRSTDGITWTQTTVNTGSPYTYKFSKLAIDQSKLIIATTDQGSFNGGPAALFKSTDLQNYSVLAQQIPYGNFNVVGIQGDHAFASTSSYRTYISHNSGTSWNTINQAYGTIDILPSGKGILIPGQSYKITTDFGVTFQNKTALTNVSCGTILPNDDHVLAYIKPSISEGSVGKYISQTNNFTTPVIVPGGQIRKMKFSNNMNGFLLNNNGLFKTTDGGYVWTLITNYPEPTTNINDIVYDDASKLYVGKYSTSDLGNTWVFTAPTNGIVFKDYKIFPSGIGYGVYHKDIYKTTNNGASWNLLLNTNIFYNQAEFNRIAFSENFIVALGNVGKLYIYRTDQTLDVQEKYPVENKDVFVYPNPASDEIQISLKEKAQLKIYDYSGKLVLQTENKNSKINISTLSSGNYLLKIETADQIFVRKFIKK